MFLPALVTSQWVAFSMGKMGNTCVVPPLFDKPGTSQQNAQKFTANTNPFSAEEKHLVFGVNSFKNTLSSPLGAVYCFYELRPWLNRWVHRWHS